MSIKWGIIGYGAMGRVFEADLRLVPQCHCIGYYSGAHRASLSLSELLTEADIIYIATPHHLHGHYVEQALLHGCHVLCEKPLTLDGAHSARLFSLARARHLLLVEGMWMRFLPAYTALLAYLARTGPVQAAVANFSFVGQRRAGSRLTHPTQGGGALYDIGGYPLSLLTDVAPECRLSHVSRVLDYSGVDLVSHIQLCGANFSGQVSVSYGQAIPNEATLWLYNEVIRIPHPFWRMDRFVVHRGDAPPEEHVHPYQGVGYVHEMEAFLSCLAEGAIDSPIHGAQHTVHMANLLDQIRAMI